jgi:hypothetical protein
MKQEENDFWNKFRRFQMTAKIIPGNTKLHLYWGLIRECMENNDENAHYIIQQCEMFIDWKIKSLEDKFGIKSS